MNKFLTFSLCLCVSILSYSQTFKSEIYGNRGLEMMRASNINSELGVKGQSGSTQIVEAFMGNSRKYNSKGVLLGTVSNFTTIPNLRTGLTLAYQKYEDKKNYRKNHDFALDTYLSYKYEKNILTGSLAYSQAEHVEKREYSQTFEYGRLIYDNFYSHINIKNTQQKYRDKADVSFINYGIGISKLIYFNKNFRIDSGIEYNIINKKISNNDRGRGSLTFYASLGYFLYDDLIVDLKYRGVGNSKFYDSVVSLGFTHLF